MLVYNYNYKVYNWFKMICFLLFYLYRSATRSPLVPARDRRRVRWMAPSWGGKLGADGLVGSLKRYTVGKNQTDVTNVRDWSAQINWSSSDQFLGHQLIVKCGKEWSVGFFVASLSRSSWWWGEASRTGELTFEEDICQTTDWSDFLYQTRSTVMIHSWLKWH